MDKIEPLEFDYVSNNGNTRHTTDYFEGVINNLERSSTLLRRTAKERRSSFDLG